MTYKIGTSYFGNRIHEHVATDLKRLKSEGFNLLCHTFNENDQVFYKKTMGEIVKMSKDEGFEVYVDPWGVGRVFGGESFSFFTMRNLDDLQILSDGKAVGAACPMRPAFRKFMVQWIEDALEMQPDKIFWDEPHFSLPNWLSGREGQWGCRCDVCKGLFHDKFGHDMPVEKTPEVVEFLAWGIKDFIEFCLKETKKRGGDNALCLLPHEPHEDGYVGEWEEFAKLDGLSVFGTDPYFEFADLGLEHVEEFTKKTIESCEKYNLEPQIWFQGFKIKSGREHLQAEAVDIAVKAGVKNLAVWGLNACEHISWIRPDDPKKVWKTFTDKFKEVREKELIEK